MKHLYDYISNDSIKNAGVVLNDITAAVNKAINNPEIYNADKYKINNDGSYRAFENIIIEFHTGLQKILFVYYVCAIQV